MLSYQLSVLAVIILLILGILWLLRRDLPLVGRAFNGVRSLASRAFQASVKRFGYIRTFVLLYLIAVSIATVVILADIRQHNFFESIGKIVVLWIPVLIGRAISRWYDRWQERHFELPQREEENEDV